MISGILDILYYIFIFLIVLIGNYFLIGYTLKKNLFIDSNNSKPQGFHELPTPRIGGLAIFLGCMFASFKNLDTYFIFIIITLPAFLSGLFEDLTAQIKPKVRLFIMLASAILAIVLKDIYVIDFNLFSAPLWLGYLITIIAIVGLINGVNMIDGYNGLASIVVLIIFSNFMFKSLQLHDSESFYICLSLILTLLGFLYFNYPGGRIFLGDGGAYFLGVFIAIFSIYFYKKHIFEISSWYIFLSIAYPVYEVIFSFLRKIFVQKKSPFEPDSFHLHMLIFRNLAFHRNSFVILFIAPIIIFFNVIAFVFSDARNVNYHYFLLGFSIVFLVFYSLVFIYLRKLDFRQRKEISKIRKTMEILKQGLNNNL